MAATWLSSMRKALCGTARVSRAAMRVTMRSVRPTVASAAGTKDLRGGVANVRASSCDKSLRAVCQSTSSSVCMRQRSVRPTMASVAGTKDLRRGLADVRASRLPGSARECMQVAYLQCMRWWCDRGVLRAVCETTSSLYVEGSHKVCRAKRLCGSAPDVCQEDDEGHLLGIARLSCSRAGAVLSVKSQILRERCDASARVWGTWGTMATPVWLWRPSLRISAKHSLLLQMPQRRPSWP